MAFLGSEPAVRATKRPFQRCGDDVMQVVGGGTGGQQALGSSTIGGFSRLGQGQTQSGGIGQRRAALHDHGLDSPCHILDRFAGHEFCFQRVFGPVQEDDGIQVGVIAQGVEAVGEDGGVGGWAWWIYLTRLNR